MFAKWPHPSLVRLIPITSGSARLGCPAGLADPHHPLLAWLTPSTSSLCTANLRTKILDFGGFDSSRILNFQAWNSHVHREFPRIVESTNLSRDSLVRRLGVLQKCLRPRLHGWPRLPLPAWLTPIHLLSSSVDMAACRSDMHRFPVYSLWRWGVICLFQDVLHETPDVTPCRTSAPMPFFRTCLARNAWCNTMSHLTAAGSTCSTFHGSSVDTRSIFAESIAPAAAPLIAYNLAVTATDLNACDTLTDPHVRYELKCKWILRKYGSPSEIRPKRASGGMSH